MNKQLIDQLQNQYDASLKMLSDCIEIYHNDIWFSEKYNNPTWQIAYHAIFFTNIYCSPDEKSIYVWEKALENYHILGKTPWPPFEKIVLKEKYSKQDMLNFISFVKSNIPEYLNNLEPVKKCWPFWYNLSQFEFHLNNLRHLQHHTGQLIERQDCIEEMNYEWLRMK
jgi:hypothetical protein